MENTYQSWHLCWEYPPNIVGGLGVACSSLTLALMKESVVRVFHSGGNSEIGSYHCYSNFGGSPLRLNFDALLDSLQSTGVSVLEDLGLHDLARYTESVLAHEPELGVIVHGHDWHSILVGVALKRMYGTPFILHIHSTQLERVGIHSKNWICELEQWGVENADRVITVSAISRRFLIKHYRVLASKISVCHNAITSHVILGQPSAKVSILLYAGRMSSQKSPELMIEVMRALSPLYPQLRLIMAGEGSQLQDLRRVVETCGLSEKIQFLGKVPHDEMLNVYKRADLLCLPSISEPFGLVATEAATRGLSVVLSECCGAAELLPSAVLVSHRDVKKWVAVLGGLIDDSERRISNALRVQKEAATRTWQDAASEVLEIYASLKN